MHKKNYLYALALTPLLMGAGSNVSNLSVTSLPVCGDTEYLTYSGGQLICGEVKTGGGLGATPDCDGAKPADQQRLLTVTRMGSGDTAISQLGCTAKGQAGGAINMTLLTEVETKTTNLGTLVTQIEGLGNTGGGVGVYLGPTDESLTGHVKSKGDTMLGLGVLDNGLVAAAAFCNKKYPGKGAHMCTVMEIFASTQGVAQKLKRDALFTDKQWVYNVSLKNPLVGTVQSGLNDNCAGYSYETADAKWQGTGFQWRQAETSLAGKGDVAANFYFLGCNTSQKIACCGNP